MIAKFHYTVNSDEFDDYLEVEYLATNDYLLYLSEVAEIAAKKFFHDHDGWDYSWPIELHLWDAGEMIGKFLVDVAFIPTFKAKKIN